jgi:hypothetical protein
MNCKQAKGKLALLIGNDLDASAVGDVQKHLGECGDCREHLQRLSSCLEALQVPAAGAFRVEGESLWPRISVRLASPSAGQKPHRLSGWAPTLAVAAACTAMFWVASRQFGNDSAPTQFFAPTSPIQYQPIDQPATQRYEPPALPINSAPAPSRQPQQKSDTIRSRDDGSSRAIPVVPVNESP